MYQLIRNITETYGLVSTRGQAASTGSESYLEWYVPAETGADRDVLLLRSRSAVLLLLDCTFPETRAIPACAPGWIGAAYFFACAAELEQDGKKTDLLPDTLYTCSGESMITDASVRFAGGVRTRGMVLLSTPELYHGFLEEMGDGSAANRADGGFGKGLIHAQSDGIPGGSSDTQTPAGMLDLLQGSRNIREFAAIYRQIEAFSKSSGGGYALSGQIFAQAKMREIASLLLDRARMRQDSDPVGSDAGAPASQDAIGVERVAAFIRLHPEDNRRIEELAPMAHMSPTKLKASFRAVMHTTIGGYRSQKRMELAAGLLRETNLPLAEIARRTGYRKNSNFAAFFRKESGMTPAAYRKSVTEADRR